MDEKKMTREEELDRFWDIDALLPARKSVPRSEHTDTAEIILEPKSNSFSATREEPIQKPTEDTGQFPRTVIHSIAGAEEKPIHRYVTPPSDIPPPKPDDEYVPDSALLRYVRIYRWKSSYQYYEDFVKTAEKLLPLKGKPCEHVPFFSYVPQYSQMDRARLAWYLYLRECIKTENYSDTDYSYLLLYIYEIINLADQIPPANGQMLLVRIWANYRSRFRQLDAYLPEWICDYSLIHHLSPPQNLDSHLLRRVMQGCRLREFYVAGEGAQTGELNALLAFCSNYDYKKSKFYTEETKAIFDQTVFAALEAVTKQLSADGKLFSASGMENSTVTRDAYSGALCSYRVKRKLEISYCSFSRSHELRFLITDVIKYTENKLRAHLGVRSKLSIYALPMALRELIDSITAHLKPTRHADQRKREQAETAAYERLYDLPITPLSLSNAAEIERASWETTERLVEAFAEEQAIEERTEQQKTQPLALNTARVGKDTVEGKHVIEAPLITPSFEFSAPSLDFAEFAKRLAPYAAFIHAALTENVVAQREAATILGKMPDAIADEINEIAAGQMGDILLEDTGMGYTVITDYCGLLERIGYHGTT